MSVTEETDHLHGKISFPGCLSKIIGSWEFQRLRKIKQLGGVHYVHKWATHTRYEHSLGTAYLAGRLVRRLQVEQRRDRARFSEETVINDSDILCIEIAALCHDLRHGPFSFVFLKKVLPRMGYVDWKNKNRSYEIFEKIWSRVENDESMEEQLSEDDMLFIREIIEGTTKTHPNRDYRGRQKPKWFLYDIMSNQNSCVDVCKCDYLERDLMHLRGETSKDNYITAIDKLCLKWNYDDHRYYIAFDAKYEATQLLSNLHINVYQSQEVNAVEHMIGDVLFLAKDGLKLSECISNLDKFCTLNDDILLKVKMSKESGIEMERAKEILKRLEDGHYYTFVGQFTVDECHTEGVIIEQIASASSNVKQEDIKVSILDERVKKPRLAKHEKAVQVFCLNVDDKDKVTAACNFLNPMETEEI